MFDLDSVNIGSEIGIKVKKIFKSNGLAEKKHKFQNDLILLKNSVRQYNNSFFINLVVQN